MSERDLAEFLDTLRRATKAVAPDYFALPAPDRRLVSRERVYCYELYHQIRCLLPDDYRYTLNAEIDKAGHPWLAEGDLRRKPDLVVHTPGGHPNLLVIEVKSGSAGPDDLKEAAESLRYFTDRPFCYEYGALLVFGGDRRRLLKSMQRINVDGYAFPAERLFALHHAEADSEVSKLTAEEIAAA